MSFIRRFIRSLIDGSRRAWLIMAVVIAVALVAGVIGLAVLRVALDERGRIERKYARKAEEACAEYARLSRNLSYNLDHPEEAPTEADLWAGSRALGARLGCLKAKDDYNCTRLRTIDAELDRRGRPHEPLPAGCAGKGE